MDGRRATELIRELGYAGPVVMLTASSRYPQLWDFDTAVHEAGPFASSLSWLKHFAFHRLLG